MMYGAKRGSPKLSITPQERVSNLQTALATAHRLRKERIYTGTIAHWEGVLEEANRALSENDDEHVRKMVSELEGIVAARRSAAGRP